VHIFILKFDRSVEVVDAFNGEAHYINVNYPKGQIFAHRYFSTTEYWDCLHRDAISHFSAWRIANKVPDEVKFAAMLVD
jgi:hypothetical protein